ncbi:hypothetical protein D3Y55_14945 [Mesorhizobium sp. DCY119]|nr:hypothetical protein D3Y55_14945 [Mesorhizobium sp. DCY119]
MRNKEATAMNLTNIFGDVIRILTFQTMPLRSRHDRPSREEHPVEVRYPERPARPARNDSLI